MNEDADFTPKVSTSNKTLKEIWTGKVDREDSIMKLVEKLEDIDNKKFL